MTRREESLINRSAMRRAVSNMVWNDSFGIQNGKPAAIGRRTGTVSQLFSWNSFVTHPCDKCHRRGIDLALVSGYASVRFLVV